jgi:hypothetical protein
MEQLQIFLEKLNGLNFMCKCNFQIEIGKDQYLEHYTIQNKDNGKFIQVIFQVFGVTKGFTNYLESGEQKIGKSLQEIKDRLAD